jgi:hypothetical protein
MYRITKTILFVAYVTDYHQNYFDIRPSVHCEVIVQCTHTQYESFKAPLTQRGVEVGVASVRVKLSTVPPRLSFPSSTIVQHSQYKTFFYEFHQKVL